MLLEKDDSWDTRKSDWRVILEAADLYLNPPKAQGEEEEEEEEEESAEPESVDGEEEDANGGIIDRITEEFSAKSQIDEFLLERLPQIPVIGLPMRFLIWLWSLWIYIWHQFLDFLKRVGKAMDTENNVVWGIHIAAGYWWPLRILIMILATIVAYTHWFWAALLLPIMRWLTDPIGRTIRFFRRALGRPASAEAEAEETEISE